MSENSTSAGRARARLHAMKHPVRQTTAHEDPEDFAVNPERIPNPTPPDNNKSWDDGHNKLSSKGD
ncbi:MAG: hypothetical protein R3Y40_05635 [Eubacteriales bacterium]